MSSRMMPREESIALAEQGETQDSEQADISRQRNTDAAAVALLLGLTLVVMWQRWVYDNWLARHDLLTFFLPWLGALGDRLRAGDIPALNPYLFSGAPFAGDPESGWMYVPAMVVFPFFEVTVAYKVMILLLLVLAGTTTYAFARVIRFGVLAALFSAISFEFGPFLFGQTDCCTVGTMTTAFFPMAFLGIELAVRAKSWPMRLAAWIMAGFAVSQMLAAWLGQGVINALVILAGWVVFRTLITPPESTWDMRTRLIRMITTGPAVLLIGFLLGAAGVLPRLAANAESINPGGTYENLPETGAARFPSLAMVIQAIMADAHANRGTSVWGIVVILMLLAVFMMRRRSVIPFFAACAVVIPALALGVPVISDLFYLLPRYEEIHRHSPGRVLWLYPFIPAMLAGGAVNELPRLPSMRGKWLIAISPLLIVMIAAGYMEEHRPKDAGSWLWIAAGLTTVLVFIIAAYGAQRTRVVPSAIAGLVVLAFLLPNGLDFVSTVRRDDPRPGKLAMWANDPWMQNTIYQSLRRDDPGGAGEFLQRQQETQPPFRFIAYGGMYHPDTVRRTYPERRFEPGMVAILQNSRPMRLGLETTQGYDPVQPLAYQEFITALNQRGQDYHYANMLNVGVTSPLLDLLNVRYIVVDRSIPENRDDIRALAENRTEVFRNDKVIIYESPTAMPRAWMVYDVRPDHGQDGLQQLATGQVSGSEVAFVDGSLAGMAAPTDGTTPQVTTTHWSPDSMTLSVSHGGNGLLVVSEVYSENWKATIDGKGVDVLQTDGSLLGIPVAPGQHTVVVRYDPHALTIGLWISGLTGVAALAVLVYAGWIELSPLRRRNSKRRLPFVNSDMGMLPQCAIQIARDG